MAKKVRPPADEDKAPPSGRKRRGSLLHSAPRGLFGSRAKLPVMDEPDYAARLRELIPPQNQHAAEAAFRAMTAGADARDAERAFWIVWFVVQTISRGEPREGAYGHLPPGIRASLLRKHRAEWAALTRMWDLAMAQTDTSRRASVVDTLNRLRAREAGASLGSLELQDWRFEQLDEAWASRLLAADTPTTKLAAMLSVSVGAFGDVKKSQDKTIHATYRRVEKSFADAAKKQGVKCPAELDKKRRKKPSS